METGFTGTFVISWSQTEIDGLVGAPQAALRVGAQWAWQGEALRVDGPNTVLQLHGAQEPQALRQRAADMVQKLVGHALDDKPKSLPFTPQDDPALYGEDRSFTVTDGTRTYQITLIETHANSLPLLMFAPNIPPRNTDLWVVQHAAAGAKRGENTGTLEQRMICFTPGTEIMTPTGTRRIEDIQPGDWVQTKDNGAQEVQWIGVRHMSGARLFAMPRLRPIRIRMGALGIDRPDRELLVSPDHQMIVQSDATRDLFNSEEVLVPARELVNSDTVSIDYTAQHVTYIHLLFDRHQIIFANGVATESFFPTASSLASLTEADRMRLLQVNPDLELNAWGYGETARRNLTQPESALLRHAA